MRKELNRLRKGPLWLEIDEGIPPGLKPYSLRAFVPGVETPGSLRLEFFVER